VSVDHGGLRRCHIERNTTTANLLALRNSRLGAEALVWRQHALVTLVHFGGILTSAAGPLVSVSWLCVLRQFPEDMLGDG